MPAGDVTGSVVTSVAMNDVETMVTNESIRSVQSIHVVRDFHDVRDVHDVHDGVAEAVSVCGGEGPVGGVVPELASRLP